METTVIQAWKKNIIAHSILGVGASEVKTSTSDKLEN